MATDTVTSIAHFQQLRNRQNDLSRKNTQALMDASRAGDAVLRDRLRAERAKLSETARQIDEAERAYQRTQIGQSEAEGRLIEHTRDANVLVRRIRTVAHVLESAAKFAQILTRLIARLP